MKKITGLGVVLLFGLILTGCGSTDTSKLESKIDKLEKNISSLNDKISELEAAEPEETEDVLEGKVKVPDTLLKTKDEVEKEFEAVGLKVKFVAKNFDDYATTNKKKISKNDCYEIEDGNGAEYFSSSDVDILDAGYYAEEGDTITVGYSDHDFDGTKKTESSSTKESTTKSSSVEPETKESEKPAASSGTTKLGVPDSDIEAIKTYKDYLDIYQKITAGYLSEYETAFKDTVLYDEATFSDMKKQYEDSFEEQKKQYEDMSSSALIGKDSLVDYLKTYRDGLADYVETIKDAL